MASGVMGRKQRLKMERDQLLELFRRMAEEIAEKELSQVEQDSAIADIGLDSLAMLELVGSLERELKIRIPDEDLNGIQSVRQLLELVEQKAKAS